MERRTRPHMGMMLGLAAAAAMMPLGEMRVRVEEPEPETPPEPRQPRRSIPAGGRTYKPNGAREMARRRKRLAKLSSPHGKTHG